MLKVIRPRYDGRVDLGTLEWYYTTASEFFYCSLSDALPNVDLSVLPRIVCPLYTTRVYNQVANINANDMGISINGRDFTPPRLVIKNKSYSSPTAFKQAMSGVYLEYETINQPQKYQLYNAIQPRYDGRLDLGTLNWGTPNSIGRVGADDIQSIIKKPSANNVKAYIKCSKYETKTADQTYVGNIGISIQTNGTIHICDNLFIGKTSAEVKALLSGIYLYYETATQDKKYQLYDMLSLSMKSLLGKQDVTSTITETVSNIYIAPLSNGSFTRAFTSTDLKKIQLKNGHKYLCCVSFDNSFSHYFSNHLDLRYNSTYPTKSSYYEINNLSLTIINQSEDIVASLFFRSDNYLQSSINVKYAFYIDLTEIGCDNLTAQQFYDRFKDYFPLLASGKNIII